MDRYSLVYCGTASRGISSSSLSDTAGARAGAEVEEEAAAVGRAGTDTGAGRDETKAGTREEEEATADTIRGGGGKEAGVMSSRVKSMTSPTFLFLACGLSSESLESETSENVLLREGKAEGISAAGKFKGVTGTEAVCEFIVVRGRGKRCVVIKEMEHKECLKSGGITKKETIGTIRTRVLHTFWLWLRNIVGLRVTFWSGVRLTLEA